MELNITTGEFDVWVWMAVVGDGTCMLAYHGVASDKTDAMAQISNVTANHTLITHDVTKETFKFRIVNDNKKETKTKAKTKPVRRRKRSRV